MKAIVLLFIGFVFSFSINAQNTFNLKELPEIDFETIWHADTARLLSMFPNYKFDSLEKYSFSPNAPENAYGKYLKQNHFPTKRYLKYNYKMPVLKGGGGALNMPVYVPDSTVNYFIRELRIVAIDGIRGSEK